MNIPAFSAQASLYKSSNRYRTSVADAGSMPTDRSIVAAYMPGPETQRSCDGCKQGCTVARNICLTKTAVEVLEGCAGSFFFGCGPVVSLGLIQAAACYEGYTTCLGYCDIPGGLGPFSGPCCPKVCGIHNPWEPGSGCCDHGEACVGAHNPNTRDGCCPVGQECHGNCCAIGEYCLEGGICSTEPGYFDNSYPPPPPQPANNCLFGGVPCGRKCCLGDEVCCFDADLGGHICKLHTCIR